MSSNKVIPGSLFLAFFHETTKNLLKCTTRESISKLYDDIIDNTSSVRMLDDTRRYLRYVQQQTLVRVVKSYNAHVGDTSSVTMDDVQNHLYYLGNIAKAERAAGAADDNKSKQDYGDEESGESELHAQNVEGPNPILMKAVKEMNDAERTAYARCVLAFCWSYFDDFDIAGACGGSNSAGLCAATDDAIILKRQDIFDYFSICCSVVKLKEVKRYLKGEKMKILYYKDERRDEDIEDDCHHPEDDEEDPTKHLVHTEQRLILLEQVLLRGVLGYPVSDPTIVVTEAKRLLSLANNSSGCCQGTTNTSTTTGDAKLQKAFDDFILAMRLAYCAVWEPGRD